MEAGVQHTPTAELDPRRDFEGLRAEARRRFLARARRAGQQAFHDLDEAADEAYQDAWLELVRRPPPAVDDPAGYLAGIMWHRFHRRELRPARAPAAPLDDRLASRDPAPDAVAADREALRTVHEALGELPERERTAVLLRSLGLGHDDVAASLGVSARRARKLSDAGHRRLAAHLESASAGERCAAVASTLSALSLGWEIAGRRRLRLERHLTGCPGCRGTVAALRREGRLAVMPVVLAGGYEAGARGLAEHAAQTAARAWDRAPAGGAEASTGLLGGALATKVVAGCVAAGVAAGCVAVAARDEPGAPKRAVATPEARAAAGAARPVDPSGSRDPSARAATQAAAERRSIRRRRVAERKAADVRRATARSQRRIRTARQAIRDAQQRTRRAQQQIGQAQQQTAKAQQQTTQAQQNIGEAQVKSQRAAGDAERAAGDVQQTLDEALGALP